MVNSVCKGSLILCCFFFFSVNCNGQWAIPWQMRGETTLDHLLTIIPKPDLPYGTLVAQGSTSLDTYIDQKWSNCSFLLYDAEKLIEGYLGKYDLKSNALAIKSKNGIRQIEVNKI